MFVCLFVPRSVSLSFQAVNVNARAVQVKGSGHSGQSQKVQHGRGSGVRVWCLYTLFSEVTCLK